MKFGETAAGEVRREEQRDFPGPFPPRERQAVELGGRFGKVEMVFPAQGKVIVRWMDDRKIEVMRYGH